MQITIQKCYRIYTEDLNMTQIRAIVDRAFTGYTLHRGTGVWNHVAEPSLVIEIITPDDKLPDVKQVCKEINTLNSQECCLLTVHNVMTGLVKNENGE